MRAVLPVVGGYNLERDPKIDCQKTTNLYLARSPEGKNPDALVPMPGIKIVKTITSGTPSIIRNQFVYKNSTIDYIVASNKVISCDTSFNTTVLGTINTSTGFVDIEGNEKQVCFIDGADGWIWDTSTSLFSKITSAGFPALPQAVTYLDGYFIVPKGGTNEFYLSNLNDGLTWDALKFAKLQSKPDTIVSVVTFHRRVYIFGHYCTEVWYNAGEIDFPLRRDNNSILEYGCAAKGSIAIGGTDEDKRLYWLSGDENGVGSIMMTTGAMPVRVSTPAIDYAIQNLSTISDATAIAYKIDGHAFYEISFNTANRTFVFDATTGMWFERKYQGKNRYIASSHAFFNGKHYIGHYAAPKLYEMSSNYYDDDGVASIRTRITRHFSDPSYKKIRINRLQLDMVQGTGTAFGLDENPHIYMAFSKDGGVTYGSDIRLDIGRQGNFRDRCIWKRLGSGRDWVFKFYHSNKTKCYILGATIDYEISGR